MIYMIIAILLAVDLLFVFYKFRRQGFFPAFIDLMLLVVINAVMGGSLGGEIIGTTAAFIISVYLWFYPPVFTIAFKRKHTGYR